MRNKLTKELVVCGFNAVKALTERHPERITRLFLREGQVKEFSSVCRYLAKEKRPYNLTTDPDLERICKSSRHQGVAAMIDEPAVPRLAEEEFLAWSQAGETMLLLSSVGNDHNLGAIVRSAAFFGVRRVILRKDDGEARLTTAAYRVAEGGMEFVEFRSISNDAAFLGDAARISVVIGADPRAVDTLKEAPGFIVKARQELLARLPPDKAADAGIGLLIALGNEEQGLSDDAKKACGFLARIPGSGDMESLNVAQAATLFLYALSSPSL